IVPRKITEELINSKRHYEMTLNNMSEGLVEMNRDGKITYANPSVLSILDETEENLLAVDFVKLFKDKDQTMIQQEISKVGRVWQESVFDETLELNSKLVSLKIISLPHKDSQYNLLAMLKDVTLQKQAERNLLGEREKYKRERNFLDNIFENSPDAIVIVDEHGYFTRWNKKATRLFGYNSDDEMMLTKAFQMYADTRAMEEMLDQLRSRGNVENYEIDFKRKDGTSVPCAVSINLLYDEKQRKIGSLSIIRDLSEWILVKERLKYLSFHDSLSGVYNRAFFEEELERLGKNRHLPLGIIICDIDGLKLINDTIGHQQGDELIKEVAGILKRSFRSSDVIARIGGDEFAVLLPDGSEEVIKNCIKRIRGEIENRNSQAGKQKTLSVSIGYAIKNELPLDPHALFKEADDNMYREKISKFRRATEPPGDGLY
ncbi:MAG: diguanylate cyclase, partial [Desulfosalsimonadaceae bacterium]